MHQVALPNRFRDGSPYLSDCMFPSLFVGFGVSILNLVHSSYCKKVLVENKSVEAIFWRQSDGFCINSISDGNQAFMFQLLYVAGFQLMRICL